MELVKIVFLINNEYLLIPRLSRHPVYILSTYVFFIVYKKFSRLISEKNGINPLEVCDVTKFVINECENLNFSGLMTIGKFGYDLSQGPNPDFICLKECKERICKELNLDFATVQLSMGMSDDFEHAVCLINT